MRPRNPTEKDHPRFDSNKTPRIIRKTPMKDQSSLSLEDVRNNVINHATRKNQKIRTQVTPGKWHTN